MMNVVVALFLVLSSSLVVTGEPDDIVEHSTEKVEQVLDKASPRDVKERAKEAVSKAFSKAKDSFPHTRTSEVSDVIRAACRISYDFSRTAATKVSSAVAEKVVPAVNQYVPDERGRAKIGRFATTFVRNAAAYGLPELLKYWVPVETAEDSEQKVKEHAKDSFGYRTSEVSNKAKDVIRAVYQNSYDFSQATATKVSSAVTEKVVPTVNQYVPDERGRAKIGRFATSFVRNAAVYGLPVVLKHWFPGGVPVFYIASRSLRDVKTEDYKEVKTKTGKIPFDRKKKTTKTDHYKEELKKLQAKVDKLERKLSGGGQNIQDDVKFVREFCVGKNNQADVKFESGAVSCLNSNAHLKADDMIRMCMMKEFSGR